MDNADEQIQRRKSPGRPATGKSVLVGVCIPPLLLEEVDAWTERYAPHLARPETIRRLIEIAVGLGKRRPGRVDRGDE